MAKKKLINRILCSILVVFVFTLGIILKSHVNIFLKSEVKGAEAPEKIYHALAIPNDPLYQTQWNYKKTMAENAWDVTTGDNSVVLAVLDTGILAAHEDLVGKLVQGYDFVGNDNDTNPDPGGGTAVYHGTIVASVLAGGANNGRGIASGCWNCKIMPIRVLDNNGGGTSDVIAGGIRYAVDHGAKVINMSFGYAASIGPDALLTSAVDYAHNHGVVMVAAAGNDGSGINYPAAYRNVIAVGAADQNDTVASWSSRGPELDVVAPGISVPCAYTYWDGSGYTTNSYATASGTSIASPQVAGLAAILISKTSSLTPDQVAEKIEVWSDKVPGLSGGSFNTLYGYGRANYYNSLSASLMITAPQNNSTITTSAQLFTGVAEPTSLVNIYLDLARVATVSTDQYGGWSYQVSNLSTGTHLIEAETTVSGQTYRLGVSIFVDTSIKVYRFWNTNGTHFYTASEAEKNNVIARWSNVYKYEGVAYSLNQVSQNNVPLYRFYNVKNNTHFYTASEGEKNSILAKWGNIYHLDGVAYYVSGNTGTPVYRFWNTNGTHFYTASEAEKNNVIARWPNQFKYEGIGYYIN